MYVTTDLTRGRIKPSPRTLAVLADQHLVSGYKADRIELWAVIYPVLYFAMCGLADVVRRGGRRLVEADFVLDGRLGLHDRLFAPADAGHRAGHFALPRHAAVPAFGLELRPDDQSAQLQRRAARGASRHCRIPWHRLWKLRRIATEFYDDLEVIPSYTMLGLKFVFCSPTTFREEFDNETQRNIRRFMDEAAESN